MNARADAASHAVRPRLGRLGQVVATIGASLPLLFIGWLKFTPPEIEALKGLIGVTPWLSWLYPMFGEAGASYLLGIVEIAAALLLIASFRSARAGLLGGLVASLVFLITSSLLLLPIAWNGRLGGFPALSPLGQFLIKDIALLGIALIVAGDSLARRSIAMPNEPLSAEQEIRTLIARWADAVQRQDMEAIVAHHAPDLVMFDVPPPNELIGIEAYRDSWAPFFEHFKHGGVFAIEKLDVTAGDRAGFATALLRCGTKEELTRDPGNRLRLTVGLRRDRERWLIAHEHHSYPYKPA